MRHMMITLVLIAIALALTGCERYALDRQMEELCKKDGGVRIYETEVLSPQEYEQVLSYVPTLKSREDYYGPEYRYVQEREILVGKKAQAEKGEGRLSRWYSAIYRKSDDYLLGESIEYTRFGGDGFTFGFHPSSNYCPKPRISLQQAIFLKGE